MHSVVHVVASVSRNAGGLFTAVSGLCKQLHYHSTVKVLSLKDKFSNIDRDSWLPVKPVCYNATYPRTFGYSAELKRQMCEMPLDIMHYHGIWMYPSVAATRAAQRMSIPLIISPHGMLDLWALKESRWKKRFAGWLYEKRNLRSAACIHALCESEYRSIRAYGLKNPVCVIPNGVDLPDLSVEGKAPPWESQVGADKNVILFLGRIHPKKGLANLIRAWHVLKGRKLKELEQWHLVIAGWSQGGHEDELRRFAQELNLGADVSFTGPLYDTAKCAALRAAKAFILPSFSEGLPMAVLEAWAYGLPVIMTRECNILEGFETGAALEIQPDVDSVAEGLNRFLGLSESVREQMGRNGLALVRERFAWPRIAAEMLEVYRWVLGKSSKPDCVRLD